MEASQHNEVTEPYCVESRVAEAIEKHNQAMRAKAIEKLKASREINEMEGMDYVDRGDYYEVVVKGPFINTAGRVGAALRESTLEDDYILFSGVPPITVKYPKTPVGPLRLSNMQAIQEVRCDIMNQVSQTIRDTPEKIHAAYRQAYYKAIQEYDERAKNKPPPDREEEIEKSRDKLLSLAQIKADQIRADQIRASFRKANSKDVGSQSGQLDPQNFNMDLAAMLSAKGTFEESSIEKQISKRQAMVELIAKRCIVAAHVNADSSIKYRKVLLALKREKYEKNHRDPSEARKFDKAMLGFKDNLSP